MTLSKVTGKGQVTLPKVVRQKLRIEPGDTITYEFVGEFVSIRKVEAFDLTWHKAIAGTMEEWNSPADDEAFGDL